MVVVAVSGEKKNKTSVIGRTFLAGGISYAELILVSLLESC